MAVRTMIPGDLVRRRMRIAFTLILLGYLALIGRLLYLQGVVGHELLAEAQSEREQPIPLRAYRGAICDRDGNPLAISRYSGTVGFDPSVVQPHPENAKLSARREAKFQEGIKRLAALLNMPETKLSAIVQEARQQFNPEKPRRFFPIKSDVSLDISNEIKQARSLLPGFGVLDGSKRIYPGGADAAQVVGFMGPLDPKEMNRRRQAKQHVPDAIGKAGLEAGCEAWLGGTPGYAIAEVDLKHREIPDTLRKLVPARDGHDVFTTLDINAQHIATEEAKRVFTKYRAKAVNIVIVEPMTGDILAMVSLPNYNPNPGKRHTITGEALAERNSTHLYEPGSTLKALTVAAALEAGIIQLDSHFYCGGALKVGKKQIHCDFHGASRRGHGSVTPMDIIRRSCNVGAAQIAIKMTPRKLYAAETRFGLFTAPELGIPAEQRGFLSMDKNENIYSNAKVARVGFGHSITTTPLHVAMAYAAIANGGQLMQPRLLAAVKDNKGNVKQSWEPQAVRRVLSPQTCHEMTAMLRSVVSAGTAKIASIQGYRVAGKTGTAGKYRPGAYVGSFVGFLPAGPKTTPRAVVLVAVDEPKGGYYGGEVAAPVFQAIARRLTDYWNVPKDDPDSSQYNEAHKIKTAAHKD